MTVADPYNVIIGYLGGTYAYMAAGFYDMMNSIPSSFGIANVPLGAFVIPTALSMVDCGLSILASVAGVALTFATWATSTAVLAGFAVAGVSGIPMIYRC